MPAFFWGIVFFSDGLIFSRG